jgi:hypothetical protein
MSKVLEGNIILVCVAYIKFPLRMNEHAGRSFQRNFLVSQNFECQCDLLLTGLAAFCALRRRASEVQVKPGPLLFPSTIPTHFYPTMTSYSSLLLLLVMIATSMASTMDAEVPQELSMDVRSLRGVEEEVCRDEMHLQCNGIRFQCLSVFIR